MPNPQRTPAARRLPTAGHVRPADINCRTPQPTHPFQACRHAVLTGSDHEPGRLPRREGAYPDCERLVARDLAQRCECRSSVSARWLPLHDRLVIVLAPADDHGGVPRSRPHRRGSARGGVPCTVPCHLCTVLGCVVHRGVEPLALPAARQKMAGFPPTPGCARLRDDYLLHLAARQSMRSNSQLDCWMRTSSSRICRARSSACARSCATGRAVSIFSSERS